MKLSCAVQAYAEEPSLVLFGGVSDDVRHILYRKNVNNREMKFPHLVRTYGKTFIYLD